MNSLKQLSTAGIACLVLASTLPMGCAPGTTTPTTSTATVLSTSASASPSANGAAVTGVLYTDFGTDGRLVPPEDPLTVQVLDNGKEVASAQTDPLGRFYISNIPAPATGKSYVIKIANVFEQTKVLFPGRVVNLSSIKTLSREAQPRQLQRVTGILQNTDGQPLANVEVRDKSSTFRKTTTDATGRFSLEILGESVEVLNGLIPIEIAASEFSKNSIVSLNTNNIRTITGKVIDRTNTNVILNDVRVKVQGSSVSARTNDKGEFSLSGAPVEPFILEVESPKGYAPFTIEIPPATFTSDQKPENYNQTLDLQPVGTVQINFIAESAPGFDELPTERNPDFISSNPESPPQICGSFINCFMFDLTGPGNPSRPEYDNALATDIPLIANVAIEGTGLTQTVTYPAAPFRIIYGADPSSGDVVRISDRAKAANVVFSVTLDNVPGGRQSVTISMTGFQTQKGIPIYVPPNDTISTELITLYRVEPISSFGDVKGVLKGTVPTPSGTELRIVYLDIKEDLNYEPILGDETNPELLEAIQDALTSDRYAVAKEVKDSSGKFLYHEYYLKNVPTGSRIMLAAALVRSGGSLSDCYIPNTSVLLNVRASQINLAPDLLLTRRPTESNCGG